MIFLLWIELFAISCNHNSLSGFHWQLSTNIVSVMCRLGLAYAGSNREDIINLIIPVFADPRCSMEVSSLSWTCSAFRWIVVDYFYGIYQKFSCSSSGYMSVQVVGIAALSCGLVAVGSGNGNVTSTIMQTMMEKTELELKDTYARFLALGVGLALLGQSLCLLPCSYCWTCSSKSVYIRFLALNIGLAPLSKSVC